jgi:type VI protein secretion system component Hcp
MAQGDSSDLLMKFVLDGNPIPAGSTAQLDPTGRSTNPLLKGFRERHILQIEQFTFKAGTTDDDDSGGGKADDAKKGKKGKTLSALATRGDHQSWRSGKAHKYPVDLQPVSFTRSIDASSSILIQNCIDCISYDSATLIKRKAAGGVAAGEVFLRLDFNGVLVINVDWSNDDEVEETCHFICRSVTISYRPQLPDGSLGAIVSGFWSMVPGEKQMALA